MKTIEKLNISKVGLEKFDCDILMNAIRENKNLNVVNNIKTSLHDLKNIQSEIFNDESFFSKIEDENRETLEAWNLILESSGKIDDYNKTNLTIFYTDFYKQKISNSREYSLKVFSKNLFKYIADYLEEKDYDIDEVNKIIDSLRDIKVDFSHFEDIVKNNEQKDFINFIVLDFVRRYRRNLYYLYQKISKNEELIELYNIAGYFEIQIPKNIPEETLKELKNYFVNIKENIKRLYFLDASMGYAGNPYEKTSLILRTFLEHVEETGDISDIKTFVKRTKYDILDIPIDVKNFTSIDYLKAVYYDKYKEIFDKGIFCRETQQIIVYAIRNNKKAFLRNICNIDNFHSWIEEHGQYSLLNNLYFKDVVNLNTLNESNIKYALSTEGTDFVKNIRLKFNQEDSTNLTFEEFKTLFETNNTFVLTLYKSLYKNIKRVDDRLRIIKEIPNYNLSYIKHNDERTSDEISEALSEKLCKKPLSRWIKEDFSSIQEKLEKSIYIKLLLYMDNFSKFINQLKTEADVSFIMLVKDNILFMNRFDNLRDMQREYYQNDVKFNAFLKKLELTDEFMETNRENILQFAIKGLGTIATTLYAKINDKQKENLKLLCKAYMAGKYENIKFYKDDLDREIGTTLSEEQRQLWKKNIEKTSHSGLQVSESYDFEKTLRLGQKPDITCIDWNTGKSATTLLANFDTNKKIICGYKNNKYIARALIRLTKLTDKYQDNRLAFKDIDVLDSLENKIEETLALFIERPYDVELNDSEQKAMYQNFMYLALDKAKELGAVLVVAPEYNSIVEETLSKRASKIEFTSKYVFISFSKNGEQYLDSLTGKATESKEGTFIQNEFYIITP